MKTNGSRCKIVQDSVLSIVAICQKKKKTSFPCTRVKLPVYTEVSTIVISNYDKNDNRQ